jgi:rSAM/selenodomain-associated transferase 2
MSEPLRISVIIPVLNEAQNLEELIPFLKKFGGEFLEDLIVVDGGSQDNSCQIAESLGANVIISSQPSRAIQLNLGASIAKGSVLFFVHADTRPLPSFAEDIQIALLKGYKAGCYRYRFDSDDLLLKINSWATRFNGPFSGGGDQTLFIRRSFFNTLGGYDEQSALMEDFEIVGRIKRRAKFYIIPKSIVVSARKYQSNSWLRVQLANLFVFILFRLGVSPNKLKKTYSTLIQHVPSS